MFLETVLIVTGEGRGAVSGGWSPGVPLTIPQGTGHPTMKNHLAPKVSSAKAGNAGSGCADSPRSHVSIPAPLGRNPSLSSPLSLASRFDHWLPRLRPASAALGLVTPRRPHRSCGPCSWVSPRPWLPLRALLVQLQSSLPEHRARRAPAESASLSDTLHRLQCCAFSHETPPEITLEVIRLVSAWAPCPSHKSVCSNPTPPRPTLLSHDFTSVNDTDLPGIQAQTFTPLLVPCSVIPYDISHPRPDTKLTTSFSEMPSPGISFLPPHRRRSRFSLTMSLSLVHQPPNWAVIPNHLISSGG